MPRVNLLETDKLERRLKGNIQLIKGNRPYSDMAKQMGVATARNDIFLDNSSNVEDIRKQIYKAFAMAEKNGSAIAICHARPNTAKCWQLYAEEFKKSGITFVPVNKLLY